MILQAIIGVSMYSTQAQEDFGSLEKAFITLFRIAAGIGAIQSRLSCAPLSVPYSPALCCRRDLGPNDAGDE